MAQQHVFDSALASAQVWIRELLDALDLSPREAPRAMRALRAGLHAIRDRLPSHEAVDLAAQLPMLIRGLYYEGWSLNNDPTGIRDRAQMIARVQRELPPGEMLDPVDVLRGVIGLLVEHVSEGEIRDVLATLPQPIESLWHDLTGRAMRETAPHPTESTGYRR